MYMTKKQPLVEQIHREPYRFTANFVDVYLNGVLLNRNRLTATSGTSVVLASGAVADDIVEIIVYDTFAVANLQ